MDSVRLRVNIVGRYGSEREQGKNLFFCDFLLLCESPIESLFDPFSFFAKGAESAVVPRDLMDPVSNCLFKCRAYVHYVKLRIDMVLYIESFM